MTPAKPSLRKSLTRFLVFASAIYLGIALPMTLMQRHLLYWPVRISLAEAKQTAAEEGVLPWLNAAGEIIGWKVLNGGRPAGTVLITHGVDGCALDRALLAMTIRRAAGYDCYILEYPGYGARGGRPSEKSLLAAADEAWGRLPLQAPVYLISESLGAGVAAHLAREHPATVSGLVLFVPYDRLTAVAQHHLPLLPAAWLLWDRFAPADDLAHYHGPLKVVIGGADWVIPARFGQRLYDDYAGPKSLQIIPQAGHAQTMAQSIEWWQQVFAFLKTKNGGAGN